MGTLLAAAHAHRGRSAATNTELARAAEKLALLCERGWPRDDAEGRAPGAETGADEQRLQRALRRTWLAVLAAAVERPADLEQALMDLPPEDLDAYVLRPMADACWSAHKEVAAAAAAFCGSPAVSRALAERTAGLPPRLEEGLQRCAERLGGATQLCDSLVGSEGDMPAPVQHGRPRSAGSGAAAGAASAPAAAARAWGAVGGSTGTPREGPGAVSALAAGMHGGVPKVGNMGPHSRGSAVAGDRDRAARLRVLARFEDSQTEYARIEPPAKRARGDALTDHQREVAERQRRGTGLVTYTRLDAASQDAWAMGRSSPLAGGTAWAGLEAGAALDAMTMDQLVDVTAVLGELMVAVAAAMRRQNGSVGSALL
ncbi:hypothetical protein WJX81_008370 [Elliptochloris bilobata]|uniref:Uncharacterized protein n=1 Tax=Elliptochloris bilobata TaxID=381761 RepID=A0AAW1R1Q6_9CHLO